MILPRPVINNFLTAREVEVVSFLKKGLSNLEIAAQLNVKEKTVKFHLTNIYRKLGVKSRTQLLAKQSQPGVFNAVEHGQLPSGE